MGEVNAVQLHGYKPQAYGWCHGHSNCLSATYVPSLETSYQQQRCQQEQGLLASPCHFRVPVNNLSMVDIIMGFVHKASDQMGQF